MALGPCMYYNVAWTLWEGAARVKRTGCDYADIIVREGVFFPSEVD